MGRGQAVMRSDEYLARTGGGQIDAEAGELDVRARWGIRAPSGCMPGPGKMQARDYTLEERAALAEGAAALGMGEAVALACLGAKTGDVYLNDIAYWRNVPACVWSYSLGGYQVMKKWLSYREKAILGRGLSLDEIGHMMNTARRIAALLLLQPALDANYRAVATGGE
jgi:Type ISP C-terminal specificity domain